MIDFYVVAFFRWATYLRRRLGGVLDEGDVVVLGNPTDRPDAGFIHVKMTGR